MKRFLTVILTLACLMAIFCPAFAVVECKVPQELPGVLEDVAVRDVLIIGGAPEENAAPDAPVQDVPADSMALGGMVDGKYATMGDLYQAWGGYEGYPDYVCGVWSTDGGMSSLTVAVTDDNAGEKGKQEILSQLADPNTVTFTTQKYSYRELLAVMDDITAQMGGGSPIVSCGVHDMENKVHVSVLETAENAEKIARELAAKHGDKIAVELGSAIILDTASRQAAGSQVGWVLVAAAVLLLTALPFALKLPARVTNTGKVVTETKPTRAQVETAITQHTETPPDRVEAAIKKKL